MKRCFKIIVCFVFILAVSGCEKVENNEELNPQSKVEAFLVAVNEKNRESLNDLLAQEAVYSFTDIGETELGSALEEDSYISYMLAIDTNYSNYEVSQTEEGIKVVTNYTNYFQQNIWKETTDVKDTYIFQFDERGKIYLITEYYNVAKNEIDIRNTSGDLGFFVSYQDGNYVIDYVDVASKAYKILEEGDILISIDGVLVNNLKYFEVSGRIAGALDTSSDIVVLRNKEQIEVSIKRIPYTEMVYYSY